jgi:hypothetical protein
LVRNLVLVSQLEFWDGLSNLIRRVRTELAGTHPKRDRVKSPAALFGIRELRRVWEYDQDQGLDRVWRVEDLRALGRHRDAKRLPKFYFESSDRDAPAYPVDARIVGSEGTVAQLIGDLETGGDNRDYRPAAHKTAHRGKPRAIPLGPRARAVLVEFLAGREPAPDVPVFSPAREREERFVRWRAARKSKVPPSQRCRRKAKPKRVPGAEYHPHAYANAVRVAAEKAGVPHWHPNQIRHTFATAVRERFGLEAAQVLLGHEKADVTQVYAERNLSLALKVAAEIG